MSLHSSVALVEHCSANAAAMGSYPNEVSNLDRVGGGLICNCLNCNYHCHDHIFIQICSCKFSYIILPLDRIGIIL